ncbi:MULTISPECIES: Panacea domain-containing protein [Paenibacillus]|uniref:hypothetical protein n=1 Tax=Paenibacillus TaxID=44249 RepID=UPI0001AFDA05|nr:MULTISPECIES: hypothetical protein [unclassified Paenibacillus]EES72631.1 hypothetical protein POTG_02795 [Paenibacillus sp. oral taxon 786 str. D14]OXL87469.1 hypothetical protein BCV73_33730 [Paenibacillus sp. SSG-1]
MNKLQNVMIYFIKNFPQSLGRTKLIKAIYLLDCEWYKIYGSTFTGMTYLRDNNGPFDTAFYDAKDYLLIQGIIEEIPYSFAGGHGFEFHIGKNFPEEIELDGFVRYLADDIINDLGNSDLNGFLAKAYSTEPMIAVQNKEKQEGKKCYGEVLDMSKLKDSPKPLFSLGQIKEVAKNLDLSSRGSDEEYASVVNKEIEELRLFRERVAESWKLIQ